MQLELFVTQSEIYAWTLRDCARQAALSEFWLALFAAGPIRYLFARSLKSRLGPSSMDVLEMSLHLEILQLLRPPLTTPYAQVQVSLHNGLRTFVVNGPARSLYGLVTSLRKVRAPTALDQSKIPFSQRKPVFSVRFLVVGVPYQMLEWRG